MTPKFDYVMCSIEESKDTDTLTIDELQSSLLVHELRMTSHVEEVQALQIAHTDQHAEQGRGRGGFGQCRRGRGRGHGRQGLDKSTIECFTCHQLGHFNRECSNQRKKANYVENDEDTLLMACTDITKANEEGVVS